jgi:type I restriction enzyme S subunit
MKIKTEGGTMTAKGKSGLVSKLRFPEFRQAGDWEKKELCEVATIIRKKAGSNKYTLMSVTAGVGLISQLEKFGREIAGAQYKNYLVIEHNDFAYNKSATKEYPEGFIGMYSGNEPGAVPNSIFTCFRVDTNAVVPKYLNYLFFWNLHGKWLKKFITVGARAHGSLNIDDNDLLALPVPFPRGSNSITEQQKIADCLSSLDELIAAQAHKLDTLKAHKKGLMQQLFPAPGQTTPTLRFPEFQAAGEWTYRKLGGFITERNQSPTEKLPLFSLTIEDGVTPKTERYERAFLVKDEKEAYKTVYPDDFAYNPMNLRFGAIAMHSGTEKVALSKYYNIFYCDNSVDSRFCEIYLKSYGMITHYDNVATGSLVEKRRVHFREFLKFKIRFPSLSEQQKIADCLSSLDELIAAQAHKLDILKAHKKGLMQQLFPNPDEAAE